MRPTDPIERGCTVERAISEDPRLTLGQKEALLAVYRNYVGQMEERQTQV